MTPKVPTAFTLQSLVDQFGGTLSGDMSRSVCAITTLERARSDELSFFTNARYRTELLATKAAAVLISPHEAQVLGSSDLSLWVIENPYAVFARLAALFAAAQAPIAVRGQHPGAVVASSAIVDPSAAIGPGAVIGEDCVVGRDVVVGAGTILGNAVEVGPATILHANVTIYGACVIGQRCIIHSGAVIGADGFGFAKDGQAWIKIPQTGRVRIGDDVEIGANTTIDRGALDDTIIEDGVKLDNQIQIGHNCRIGAHTVIAGCTGIAGSTTIGRNCAIGGAAMILGHLDIGDNVTISVATVISHSLPKPGQYSGFYPAAIHSEWERNAAVVRHLGKLRERVRALEKLNKTS